MNLIRLTFTFIASAALFTHSAIAITADELAQFLGIQSWGTTVALPKDSFTVDLLEIKDGKVVEAWLRQGDEAARDPKKGLLLMLGPHEGHYRLTLRTSAGTHGVVTKVPLFPHSLSSGLPEEIGVGDFIVFGQPKAASRGADDVAHFERSFLLRVKIKTLSEAEEIQAQRCLANAKLVATACKLYALDNGGRFPTKVEEIFPDYVADKAIFTSPLASEPHKMGYEMPGGKDTDPGSNVLVQGRFTAPDGRRSVVYVNLWGALEWR